MYEWLEGLQKSAKRTAAGVAPEDVRRAETESGNPFPEELDVLFKRFNGGDFQGDVTLFALHGSEGEPSVMEKTRLKLEGLPAAGVWRIGVKGPHRQLFAARKSAMREQSDEPLPGWAEVLADDDWLYGTWETEARELKLYRSFASMIEVLVPPAEVEEFGERTFARALVAVHGRLNDISEEYDQGERSGDEEGEDEEQEDEETEEDDEVVESLEAQDAEEDEESERDEETGAHAPKAEERAAQEAQGDEEDAEDELEEEESELEDEEAESEDEEETEGEEDEELRKPVVAAAQRRVGGLRKSPARQPIAPEETPQRVAKKGAGSKAPARKSSERPAAPASRGTSAAKKAAAKKTPAKKAAQKTPVKKAAAKKSTAKTSASQKAPAKKAAAKKTPAKKAAAQKAPARKSPAKKSSGKTPNAKKAPAKKGASRSSSAPKRGASRGKR